MARHGPILKDNEATGSGKVFKYLPGLPDIIKKSKMAAKGKKKQKHNVLPYVYIWRTPDIPPWRPLCSNMAEQQFTFVLPRALTTMDRLQCALHL